MPPLYCARGSLNIYGIVILNYLLEKTLFSTTGMMGACNFIGIRDLTLFIGNNTVLEWFLEFFGIVVHVFDCNLLESVINYALCIGKTNVLDSFGLFLHYYACGREAAIHLNQ